MAQQDGKRTKYKKNQSAKMINLTSVNAKIKLLKKFSKIYAKS